MVAADFNELLSINIEHAPLRLVDNALRIGNSRLTLDLLVEQYENGLSPEDLVRAYDSLDLADAHAAIAYYLRNRDKVRAYLHGRKREADTFKQAIEAKHIPLTRDELLARRSGMEIADAPPGK